MASGILYPIFRPFAKVTIQIYFRKLHIKGRSKVPMDGPLIIASNHPNSFAEPVIFATHFKRRLHFLVRGDVFENVIIAWLLRQTNQIPIYRIRDGYKSLKRNNETFEACYNKLDENEAIVIFSEGLCILEKRLRPIKKGTARLALGTIETKGQQEDFYILPVGVNYTHGDRYRREVMVNVGQPIKVEDFWEDYRQDASAAVNNLTRSIEDAIRPLVIEIVDKEREPLYNDLMDIVNSIEPYGAIPTLKSDNQRFVRDHQLADRVNTWTKEETSTITESVNKLKASYPSNIPHYYLKNLERPDSYTWLWMLLSPIGIVGVLLHSLPFTLSLWLGTKFRRSIEFYTAVRMASLMIFTLALYLALVIWSLSSGKYEWLGLVIAGPILGWAGAIYMEKLWSLIYHVKWRLQSDRSKISRLRDGVLEQIIP